jgi:hypothetical protein
MNPHGSCLEAIVNTATNLRIPWKALSIMTWDYFKKNMRREAVDAGVWQYIQTRYLSDNSHHSTQTVSRDYRRHGNRRCSSLPFFVVHELYLNLFPLMWGVYSWHMKQVLGMGSFDLQSRVVHNKNVNCTSRFFWWNWEHFTLNSFLYIMGIHPRFAGSLRPAATL